MEHFISSLFQLFSFSHGACDAILQTRQIEIANAYEPGKAPGWRDSVFVGFWVAFVWTAGVLALAIRAWRPENASDPRVWQTRLGFPVFALAGMICLGAQLKAMADYASTCKALLH